MKCAFTLRKIVLSSVALATTTLGFTLGQSPAGAIAAAPAAAFSTVAAAAQAPRLTEIAAEAVHQTTLGISYSYGGGHGPHPAPLNSHVDCSGFVRELYNWAYGVDIGGGNGDSMIRLSGEFIPTSHPVPGDVGLFGVSGHAPAYHAGIYIGLRAGQPAIAASPTTGENIKIQQWFAGYFSHDFMGYWHYRGATPADSGQVQQKMDGHFDTATGITGGLLIVGWALDPQRRTSGTPVAVTVDNRRLGPVTTGAYRPDVNKARSTVGNHGFRILAAAAPGRHTVCVTALPAGTSTTAVSLGCRVINTPGPTRGAFDNASAVGGRYLLSGWAYDPNNPAASNAVRVTIDGRSILDVRASGARPDVNLAFRIAGNHGFAVRLLSARGRHVICTISLPASGYSTPVNFGCRAVTVA